MASGPVILLGIQMEKKIAPSPPSFMRGISMLPLELRAPRSKSPSRNLCVVSSCVSTTIEEKCTLRAFSEMESANTTRATPLATETQAPNSSAVRSIFSPKERKQIVNGIEKNGMNFQKWTLNAASLFSRSYDQHPRAQSQGASK